MNHLTTILLSGGILLTGIAAAAQDMIIFRDGRVKSVKIIQTNNDKTLYRESADKHAEEEYVENTKVFMLKFKTRGNVVFNNKGERILATSEPLKIPKDAVVVYYKDGREVPAYNLQWMQTTFLSDKAKRSLLHRLFPKGRKCLWCAIPTARATS